MSITDKYTLKELGLKDKRETIPDLKKQTILQMRKDGYTYKKIAEYTAISYVSVYLICNPEYRKKLKNIRKKSDYKYINSHKKDRLKEYDIKKNIVFRKKLAIENKKAQS